jgi:hypothetical protein
MNRERRKNPMSITTIHKPQGSEYGTVIVTPPPVPSPMSRRNLLYTATGAENKTAAKNSGKEGLKP